MIEEHPWLTVDQLLALAAAEGFNPPEITARKIERWRKEGLLPPPRRISLGRPLGTRSEYPPGTDQQLLALCRLRRRFPHDLDAVRFGLWYERYPLPIDGVKQSMEQLLRPITQILPLNESDPLDAAEQLVSQKQSKPRRSSSGRHYLKQLRNADEVNAVLTAVLQLALGGVPGFTAHADEEFGERSLAQMFIEALGLNRAEQLTRARADLKGMLGFKQAAKAMEMVFGPDAFGWGMFSELPNDPAFYTLLLSFLIRLGSTSHRVGMNEVEAALRKNKPIYQWMQAFLRALHREYPAIAEEILAQTQVLDLSDPHTFDQIHAIFATARANHLGELDAFFRQYPELALPN